MKRLASIIAATAAAAAVASAISLPAGADNGGRAAGSDDFATFTSCLRAHGLAIPEGLDPMATKVWVGEHEGTADVEAALTACDSKPGGPVKRGGPPPEELVACLRVHGLTPPATIDQLKPWMAQQSDTEAGKAALSACGVDSRPVEKAPDGGGCAGDKEADAPKPADKANAARAKAARATATPAL